MGIVSREEILRLHAAVVHVGLDRQVLLGGLDPAFIALLHKGDTPAEQILLDLETLNAVEVLTDRTVPLAVWLANAVALSGPRTERPMFESALARLLAPPVHEGAVSEAPPHTARALEVSLGRAIAKELKLALESGEAVAIDSIKTSFSMQVDRVANEDLAPLTRSALPGAVRFAILEIEADVLRGHFGDERTLLVRALLETIVERRLSGFHWLRDACALIRDMQVASTEWWERAGRPAQSIAARIFEDFFVILKQIATLDFVVLWEVESTILHLVKTQPKRALRRLESWAERGTTLERLFANHPLPRLIHVHPEGVLDLVFRLARNRSYRQDFWLARSLLYTIREIAASVDGAGEDTIAQFDNDAFICLHQIVEDYAKSADVAFEIRCVALSVLPFVARHTGNLRLVEALLQRTASQPGFRWGRFALALELRRWPRGADSAWCLEVLLWLSTRRERYLEHAVATVAKDVFTTLLASSLEAPKVTPRGSALPGIVCSSAFLEESFRDHPECRERVQFIIDWLEWAGEGRLEWITDPQPVAPDALSPVHHPGSDRWPDGRPWHGYVEFVKARRRAPSSSGTAREPPPVRVESYETALIATGSVIAAVDHVYLNGAPAAWSLGRPPGHLANNSICVFNNIAVGAHHALHKHGCPRILIIDCDAHFGAHTARCFSDESRVVYFSFHIDDPHTIEVRGIDGRRGCCVAVSYEERQIGDHGYRLLVDRLLVPIMRAYGPALIMISAGIDGHREDPLTHGELTERAYIHLANRIGEYAALNHTPVVGTLEGGYGLRAVARSMTHMINLTGRCGFEETLIDLGPPHLRERGGSPNAHRDAPPLPREAEEAAAERSISAAIHDIRNAVPAHRFARAFE